MLGYRAQIAIDDVVEVRGIEARLDEINAEDLPESRGVAGLAVRGDEGFCDGEARGIVLVEDVALLLVNVQEIISVIQGVLAVGELLSHWLRQIIVAGVEILGEEVCGVHAEAVDATIAPEAQCGEEVLADVRVIPVQVGLFLGEDVEIPLAGCAIRFRDAGPCPSAEDGTAASLAVARRVCPFHRGK